MSIKIEQVNVKNLGPLNDFSSLLKQVNLFYGRNEHGKTYLVEFLYKCLFKNKALGLRELSASGQVVMSGLEEKDTLFSTAIKKKLEDFWENDLPGLPRDFSKLLVVKGADLDFCSGSAAGIDGKILKEFLSGESLLEQIGSKIKSTEGSATYENGKISGGNMGMVKDYNKALASINQIDDSILEVNRHISGGKLFELNKKIEELSKQKNEQEQACRHLAFNLANQITDLKAQLQDLPADLIATVDKNIVTYNQKQTGLENKQQALEKNQEISKDYLWLEFAIAEYQKLILAGNSTKLRSGVIWMVISLIAIALAVLLVLIRQPYIGVGMILMAVIFGFIYLRGLIKGQSNIIQLEEIRKIVTDYKSRFGDSEVVQAATLEAKQKDLQPAYFAIEQLTNDIKTLTDDLKNIEIQINQDLNKLPDTKVRKGEWQTIINALQGKRTDLDSEIREKEIKLSSLNIVENDYMQEPISVPYDPRLLQTVSNDLETCVKEKGVAEAELQGLKQVVCTLTRKDINSSWDDLVEALNNKRQEEVNRYKDITAGILARIKVNEVLGDLREIEDRIEEGLSSKVICQALMATTGHFERVEKEDRELYVADSYGRYRISDLSTGAREQVLLGLRIGFAAMILAGTPLFLILDDAFQHSDWERRERLVKKLFALSNEGWQIIYFTMDDHIRKLFESNAKEVGRDQYQTIMLS